MENSTISRVFKDAIKSGLQTRGLTKLCANFEGQGICLMYHRLTVETFDPDSFCPNAGLSVSVEAFERQLAYFTKNYNCLSVAEAVSALKEASLPKRSLILTFDDGYRDNFSLALPLLKQYQVPATIFVSTAFIDNKLKPWWDELALVLEYADRISFKWQGRTYKFLLRSIKEKYRAFNNLDALFKTLDIQGRAELLRLIKGKEFSSISANLPMLSAEELFEFSREPLITIGAHTVNHAALRPLTKSAQYQELSESKRYLTELLGKTPAYMAYPYGEAGQVKSAETEVAKELGYEAAFTTRSGQLHSEHSEHLFALPRVAIDYFDTIDKIKWKLSAGGAFILQKAKRVVTL